MYLSNGRRLRGVIDDAVIRIYCECVVYNPQHLKSRRELMGVSVEELTAIMDTTRQSIMRYEKGSLEDVSTVTWDRIQYIYERGLAYFQAMKSANGDQDDFDQMAAMQTRPSKKDGSREKHPSKRKMV